MADTNNEKNNKITAITTIDPQAQVIQSNALVEGCYYLNDIEQRLLFGMISQLDQNAQIFKPITVKITEIAKLCGLTIKNSYTQINDACDKLIKQAVITKHTDPKGRKTTIRRPWFMRLDTYEGPGLLTFEFHKDLTQELIQLAQLKYGYVSMDGQLIGKLKSSFSQRFYVLFLQYAKFGQRSFTIAEIIEMFELQGKYLRNKTDKTNNNINVTMLLKRVVFPSVKDINEKTPMKLTYELQKIGRQITGIDFWIKLDKTNQENVEILDRAENREWRERNDVAHICKKLIDYGFDGNQLNTILNRFNNADDFMTAAQAAIQSLDNSKNIKNPGGFLRKQILSYDIEQQKILAEVAEEERKKINEENRTWIEIIENAKTWEELINFIAYQSDKTKAIKMLDEAVEKRKDLLNKYKSARKKTRPEILEDYQIDYEKVMIQQYGPEELRKLPKVNYDLLKAEE